MSENFEEEERLQLVNPGKSFGQTFLRIANNWCFGVFVFAILILSVIAVSYQPPNQWLQSTKALTKAFSAVENATFHQDESILRTGEDIITASTTAIDSEHPVTAETVKNDEKKIDSTMDPSEDCNSNQAIVNCSDPKISFLIKKFNLKVFPNIMTFDYQTAVQGSQSNECDVAWRFRSKKERSWRKYRDFRRFTFGYSSTCELKITGAGKWHSGKNAQPARINSNPSQESKSGSNSSASLHAPAVVIDDMINDTIPMISDPNFRKGKYLYYARGGDYCKSMNHYMWSLLCALGEAQYLHRTFVMDLSVCLSSKYTANNKDEEGKDFRYYFDFEHLKNSSSIIEEEQFLKEWKKWNKQHKDDPISVKRVTDYRTSPMRLKKEGSSIIWRIFDAPEPDNYWYRVCEGRAEKYIERPWNILWKSKHLMNIVTAISGRLDWNFDAVHVVRGEKAENKELWPNLDHDTSPDALLGKLKNIIPFRRNLYIATNEPDPNYFDRLRSQFKVFLLDDFKDLWGKTSEWYNETSLLNNGQPVDFDGYMRVELDTEVFYRGKTRVDTFNNLTRDCKDGVNTCYH